MSLVIFFRSPSAAAKALIDTLDVFVRQELRVRRWKLA